ncbi:MAG: hypothetical protein IIZ06_03530 [Kiritimatiellae bacterium]|nr:hypothetical protein [Kiritimatiellia bacterium]
MANEIAYKSEPGLKTGYRLASHKRVIIDNVGNRFENRHVVQLVPPTEDWRKARVYSIHLTPEQMRRWPCQPSVTWVVAMNDRAVESYIAKRYGRIAQQAKGMAKSALSKLAHKISALDRDDSNATPHAQRVAERETSVRERVSGDKYILDVRDDISFAKLAVKGGDFGIQLAMKKAANKVAGYIQHTCKKILLPGELPTPFPEIRRRRSA